MAGVTVFGALGYRIGGLSWQDAFYQTVVTITTVGYSDITPPGGMRTFTIIMVALGPILLALLVSVITGAFIEEQIQGFFGRAKVESRVRKLQDHIFYIATNWAH